MRKNTVGTFFLLLMIMTVALNMTGCGIAGFNTEKKTALDYTVVESEDWPAELKKLIEERKGNTLKMTYTTKDYTYAVAGYGTMATSGYSIRVNDVYLGENAVCVDVSLLGPGPNEKVTKTQTTPIIVLKFEKRDESVLFSM